MSMLTSDGYPPWLGRAELGGDGPPPAISTTALRRRFGSTAALDGLDLAVGPGEIYGFLGPNGAGKSTLIRILCTLLLPSGGRAEVAGHDVVHEAQAVRLKMGAALQAASLDDRQTGRELLELQARLYGLRRKERHRRVAEVLDLVNIGDTIDRRIGGYSGGMKRRIDLAAALVHNPEVLFLDEPTTGLDPESRAAVWDEVRRLNSEFGLTVFLTTQYLEEADALADRIGIIRKGRLVAEGTPTQLKRLIGEDVIVIDTATHDPSLIPSLQAIDGVSTVAVEGTTITVTSEDPARSLVPLAQQLTRSEVQIRSLNLRAPTLDEVFRHVVSDDRTPVAVR